MSGRKLRVHAAAAALPHPAGAPSRPRTCPAGPRSSPARASLLVGEAHPGAAVSGTWPDSLPHRRPLE